MKLKSIFAIAAMCIMTASCGVVGNSTGTAQANNGTTNGQASGAALKSLYSQYKTNGSVDLKNINNIISMAQLANGIQGLKNLDDKNQFYIDFASGLILGSQNLVTQSTSMPVTGLLGTLASGTDLSALTSVVSQNTQQQQNSGSNLSTLVGGAALASSLLGSNTQQAASNITETTAGVANTLSTLSNIFSLFQ